MPRLEIEITASADKLDSAVKSSLGLLGRLQKVSDNLKVQLFKADTVQDINRVGSALTIVTGQMKTYINEATKGSVAFQDQKASAIIDNLNAKLLTITGNTQLFGTSLKNSKAEISAYQGAINSLLQAGVNPLDSRIRNLSNSIKSLNAGEAARTQSQIREQFKATGQIIPDLENKIKRLRLALSGATSTRDIALYNIRLKESQNELKRLQTLGLQTTNATKSGFNQATISVNQFNTSLQKTASSNGLVAGVRGQIGSLVTTYASLYALVAGAGRVISSNAKLSDSLVDVRRTAGLTESETNNLLNTFKQLDNRTGLKGLADIAGIAGQMGIAKNEIAGFTATLDQLATVLSNEIKGGAEEVASSLGKINGVFEITSKEGITAGEAMNKTGSAILKLGQDGLATGEFLTDFSQRVAGIAKASSISLPAVLAYGSVMEEAGVRAEVAGTALNRFVSSLAGKRNEFFTVAKLADANLTIKEFTRLINTDADAAMQLFFKGLNSGNPSLTTFNDRLAVIAMRAGPSKNAIIALAQNQEKLAEKTAKATEEFNKGTLVQDQYDLKNANLAASTDKFSKSLENLTTSSNVQSFLQGIIDSGTEIISSFDRIVSSKSWKEFFTRIDRLGQGKQIDYEIGFESLKKANDEVYKLDKNVSDFVKESNFKKLGVDKFNEELGKAKTAFDNATKASTEYEAAVIAGRFKESKVTVAQFKIQESIAKSHYLDMQKLQAKLGFGASTAIVKVNLDSEDAEEETKKQISDREAAQKKLESILEASNDRIAVIGKEERAKELAQLDVYYAKSFEVAKGNKTALETLANNKGVEIAAINAKWDAKELEERAKIESEINSILERSVIERVRTRQQELNLTTAKYTELRDKYKDNLDDLAKLDEAYNNEKIAINAKYDEKDFQNLANFIARSNRNREQALIEQLELESRVKIAAAKGDEEKLNAIYADFAEQRKAISKDAAKINILANNDGTPLYKDIEFAKLELEELKEQFSNGVITYEMFESGRKGIQHNIDGLVLLRNSLENVADISANAFTSMLFDGEDTFKNLGKAFKSLASSIIADLIRIQAVKAIGNVFSGGLLGGIGKIFGFASGGYTGDIGTNKVAGVVHGGEYVFDAATTSRNRALFEAIDSGKSISSGSISTPSGGTLQNNVQVFIAESRLEGSTLVTQYRRAEQEIGRYGS